MPKTHHKAKHEGLAAGLDRLSGDERVVAEVRKTADAIGEFYGFEHMRVSPVESAGLFAPLARAGFLDERPPVWCKTRNGDEILLCFSAALGAVRAYFSHRMQALPHPLKMVVEGDTFSLVSGKESYRDHRRDPEDAETKEESAPIVSRREWALVMIGEEGLIAETEIIQVLWKTCAELGLTHDAVELRLNATGCSHCRSSYRSALGAYFRTRTARLCAKSKRDVKRVPTKVLSCGDERCRGIASGAPQILDFLCEGCKKQLRSLLEFLDEARIPYFLDGTLFREGSWLGEMVFVVVGRSEDPAGQEVSGEAAVVRAPVLIAEGGRLSRAAQLLEGKELAAASGTLFLDAAADEIQRRSQNRSIATDVFFVQLGDLAKRKSLEILEVLREGGIGVKESLGRDSIKIQLKIAEHIGARFALVLGQKEALDATIIVREVESSIQETISQEKLVDFLKKKLKK